MILFEIKTERDRKIKKEKRMFLLGGEKSVNLNF